MKLLRKKVGLIAICDFIDFPPGGEVSFLTSILKEWKYEDLEIDLIGMTHSLNENVGNWQKRSIGEKEYNFFPVFKEVREKEKTRIPFRFRMVWGLLKFRKEIMKKKYDILYIHCPELILPFLGDNKTVVVYHVHGEPQHTLKVSRFSIFRFHIFSFLYNTIIKIAITKSKKVIWVSQKALKSYLGEKYSKEKNIVIPSPYDSSLFCLCEEDNLVKKTNQIIIFVGRLSAVKNLNLLIDSFKLVREEKKNVKLILCGDGEERIKLERNVEERGLKDDVIFTGYLKREEIRFFLNKADVFVLTSLKEGSPVCVVEALAMGVPVVTVDVGDVKEIIRDGYNGYVVERYDPVLISTAIVKILREGRDKYKENCIKSVLARSPSAIANRVYDVLKSC
jgi:glycosyltransferase involved in cell wall biosynthesis